MKGLDTIRPSILAFKAGNAIRNVSIVIILSQSGLVISQAWEADLYPDYEIFIIPFVKTCDIFSYPQRDGVTLNQDGSTSHNDILTDTRNPLKWYLNCLSYRLFDTPKLIPIFFNLGLMPLVFLLTKEITKDKLISLIALTVFVFNPLYSQWVTSGTYDQTWCFFLILSAYLLFKSKSWPLAIPSFLVSLSAKTLGVLYLPALWYTSSIEELDEYGRNKKYIFIFWTITSLIIILLMFSDKVSFLFGGEFMINLNNFNALLFDNLLMLYPQLFITVIFGIISVWFKPKEPSKYRKLCAIWLINGYMTTEIIYLFTNQFQFVYRFVPFAVFMSIFIGIVINDLGKYIIEKQLAK